MLLFYPGDNNEFFHKLQAFFPTFFKEKPGDLETQRPRSLEHVIMMIRGRTQSCRTLGHLLTATYHQRKVLARQSTIDPDDVAVVMLSPGPNATSPLKCTSHTHFTLINQLHTVFGQLNPAKEDRVLVSTHVSCRSMDFFLPLISHVTVVAIRGYKTCDDLAIKFTMRVIEREKINCLCFGPTMLHEFINYLQTNDTKELFIHWGRVVGYLNQETYKLALNYVPGLIVGYGMLENLAIAQTSMHEYTDKKLEFTGVPTPGTELKVIGESSPIADLNEIGEIAVRSVYNHCPFSKHYLGRLKWKSLAQVDMNGWMVTGDVGYMSGDGHVRVMGRTTDVIIRGGHRYYARSIEEVLTKHPQLEAAVVVGVPDKLYQQKICAVIKAVTDGSANSDEIRSERLKMYCEQRETLVDYFIVGDDEMMNDDKTKLTVIATKRLNLG